MSTNPQQQNRSSLLCQEANFVKQNSDTRAWATDHTDQKGSFFAMLVVTTKLLDWVSLGTKCLCMQRIVGNKNKVECSSETTIQTSDINKTTQNSTNINDCLPQLNNCIDKQNCNEVKKLVNCFSRETSCQIRICQWAQLIEFEHNQSAHNFRQTMWMWWGGTAQKRRDWPMTDIDAVRTDNFGLFSHFANTLMCFVIVCIADCFDMLASLTKITQIDKTTWQRVQPLAEACC